MGLTTKQRLFVDEYLKDFNATQAAIRAGYSEKTAHNIGWENVRKREISEEIQKHLEGSVMSREEALSRLSDIARGSAADYLRIDHTYEAIDLSQMKKDGKLHLIKKYSVGKQGKSIELYDAQAALSTILKEFKPDGSDDKPFNIKVTLTDD